MNFDKYQEQLLEISEKMGLLSSMTEEERVNFLANRKEFAVREAWARYIIETVLWDINPEVTVRQLPQYSTFDALIESGKTIPLEAKCRDVRSDKYKTSNISYKKGDAIEQAKGWLLVFYNVDGVYRIWDLEKYKPTLNEWSKERYTAGAKDLANWRETEQCWEFDNDAAIISGRLRRNNGTRKEGNN